MRSEADENGISQEFDLIVTLENKKKQFILKVWTTFNGTPSNSSPHGGRSL